jgi:hypothetical protein
MDTNLTDLRDGVDLKVPKTQNAGVRVDSLGTPTYSWRDMNATVRIDETGPTKPSWSVFRGNFRQMLFEVNDEGYFTFHMPHEYVTNSPIYIHVHWSHAATLVTGGSVTWAFELSAAKGHNQGAFNVPVTISVVQNASTVQYQHLIAEGLCADIAGAGGTLDLGIIEPDTLILGRVYLAANNLTVSGGGVPNIFLHEVDLHIQTTVVGTKQKQPPFWT